MGQRDAGVGRATQRRGDARHHFVFHAVRAQVRDLLAAAAEHEGIAALEPHHALAGARALHHQVVDALLLHPMPARLLADRDALGIAARQRQHRIGHQLVVQDHVGGLQAPQRVQGEQAGVARPGADHGHRAGRCRRGAAQRAAQAGLGGDRARGADRGRHRAVHQPVVEAPPLRQVRMPAADRRAEPLRQFRQPAPAGVEHALDLAAQARGQRRGHAAGADRDRQRPAPHQRRQDRARALGVVDHIDPGAAGTRRRAHLRVHRVVVGRRDGERGAVQQRGLECRRGMHHLAPRDPLAQPRVDPRAHDTDARAGIEQSLHLARRHRAGADHQHVASAQVEEHGVVRAGLHAFVTVAMAHASEPATSGEMTAGTVDMPLRHIGASWLDMSMRLR